MRILLIQAAILIALFLATGAIADATFRIKAGNSALPEGARIVVGVSGEGCDCRATVSGKADSRGYVTVILRSGCEEVDAAKCKAIAKAEVTAGGVKTIYKGSAKLTQTTAGPYVSTVILVP